MRAVTARVQPSEQPYAPSARAERLIAMGRLILAVCSLVAVYFEPSTPARFQRPTYAILLVYSLYALLVVLLAWRSAVLPARGRLASHVGDLLLFSVFVYLTEGPASPFFLYFVFSLFCATLRFRWRGIVATGVAAMLIYGVMGLAAFLLDRRAFEWSRFAIREAYLPVVTSFLVYLGIYQEQLRRELLSLATWPREVLSSREETLAAALGHGADVLGAARMLLLWEEEDEPWVYTALWSDAGALESARFAPGELSESVVAQPLHASSFLLRAGERVTVMSESDDGAVPAVREPLDVAFAQRFAISDAVTVPVEGESVRARLFALDVRGATLDHVVLARIIGRLVGATLEEMLYLNQIRQIAGSEERLRLARDLHDGIIQSLGGAGLQLQAIRPLVSSDPTEAVARIEAVQRVIEAEQRELRSVIRELRLGDASSDRVLNARLEALRQRYLLEWGLSVELSMPQLPALPSELAEDVYRLVNEALSNAARHGSARSASIVVDQEGANLKLTVVDDGRGFPFTGHFDLAALEQQQLGPRTLKERVRGRGGELVIDSAPGRVRIDVTLDAGGVHA